MHLLSPQRVAACGVTCREGSGRGGNLPHLPEAGVALCVRMGKMKLEVCHSTRKAEERPVDIDEDLGVVPAASFFDRAFADVEVADLFVLEPAFVHIDQ
jgi:hypothetical protein